MTLTAHAITGAALASFMPAHPILAFSAGFVSHFALDAIPHLDYPIRSDSVNPDRGAPLRLDRAFFLDFMSIGGDAFVGFAASLFFFAATGGIVTVVAGAAGAVFPDFLQFVYSHFRHEPLVSLQRFHRWIHTDIRLKGHPVVGIASQLIFVVLIVFAASLLRSYRGLWW